MDQIVSAALMLGVSVCLVFAAEYITTNKALSHSFVICGIMLSGVLIDYYYLGWRGWDSLALVLVGSLVFGLLFSYRVGGLFTTQERPRGAN